MLLSSLFSTPIAAGALAVLAVPTLAQDRTTEAGEASITDPTTECTAFFYAPVSNALSQFPTVWQSATIVSGDSDANALWAQIEPTVPTGIPTHGDRTSSLLNLTYDTVNDPDCWWTIGQAGHKCTTPKHGGLPNDTWNVPEPLTMGYGFDDGPNCSHNIFYDFLSEQSQKATMFYIGSNVMNHPVEAQRAIADGHEICVHTWSHPYMTSFQSPDAFAELYYSIKAIKLATGVTPTCWRPPYGDVDDRIRAIAHGLNLTTISWGWDSNDWQQGLNNVTDADVDNFYQQFVNNATSGTFNTVGGIMLTHELNNYTMSKAIQWYPKLKAAFKSIVPVNVALNITRPYVETDHFLPTFAQYTAGHLSADSSNVTSSPGAGIPVGSIATPGGNASTTTSSASSNSSSGSSGKSSAVSTSTPISLIVGVAAVVLGAVAAL